MSQSAEKLLDKNKKIDQKIVANMAAINQKLPDLAKAKQGASFSISHPLSKSVLFQESRERT